jgi:ribosomal protein S24E
MKILKILKQRENPLFNRKEIEINIETNIAPKTSEAEAFIAKEFSSSAENIKVKKIKGRFGSNNFIITANIYYSKEDKDKIEKSKKEKTQIPVEIKPEERKE